VPCEYVPTPNETSRLFILTLKMDGAVVFEHGCRYQTGVSGVWKLQVRWGEGEEPPVEPPTGDVAELWRKLATAKRVQAANLKVEADLFDAMAEKYESGSP